MGWTYPCTAVPGCPFLPMRHRVRCRFSCAGDRLRLMTPSEASPWFVTGRPPRTEVYERVPFQGWSVENSPGAKHRLVSTLQPAHLRRAGRCSSSPESASASALYFASLTRPAIAQLREFGEEPTFYAGRNYQGQHERREGLCGRRDNEGASLINEDSHVTSV